MPIHEDCESSGVTAALRRQERWVNQQFPRLLASADMTANLFDCKVTVPVNPFSALRSMATFRRARGVLDRVMSGASLPPLCGEPTVDCRKIDQVTLMNMTRMSYGDMLESATRLRASRYCSEDELPSPPHSRRLLSRLMVDSYLIACWTSAHAEWVDAKHRKDNLASHSHLEPHDLPIATPGMYTVPYAVTAQPDLGGLLEHRTPCQTASSTTVAMMAVLSRCTNAGSRG